MNVMRVFIGVDRRQMLAYTVCRSSIERRVRSGGMRVVIEPLFIDQLPMKREGLTQFTFSRYAVPALCGYKGNALFMDADMICLTDIRELAEAGAGTKSVAVVKNGQAYQWPSLMWFNNEGCKALTWEVIERGAPQSFEWANGVSALPKEWNHLIGYDPPNPAAKILHFTKGIPCWNETKDSERADDWLQELAAATHTVSFAELMQRSRHHR